MRGLRARRLVRAALLLAPLALIALAPTGAEDQEPNQHVVRCVSLVARGGVAFLGETAALEVRDVSDPLRPRTLGRLGVAGTVFDVNLATEELVLLAAGTHGLYVVDISEPEIPTIVHRHDTPGNLRRVVYKDRMAILGDGKQGLSVVDLSLPDRPLASASVATRGEIHDLALRGSLLAVAEGSAGARLFDVTRPDVPRELSLLGRDLNVRGVALTDDLVLLAAGTDGLWIYRIAQPERPELLATLEPLSRANHVAARSQLALVSNGSLGLQSVDLSDPGNPVSGEPIKLHRAASAGRVSFDGDHAYVALDRVGMGIVDVSDAARFEVLLPRRRTFTIGFPSADRDDEN